MTKYGIPGLDMPQVFKSELPRRYHNATFDNFKLWMPNEDDCRSLELALCTAKEFADGRLPSPFLWLSGPVGTGKTHLAAAVINHRKRVSGEMPLAINVGAIEMRDELLRRDDLTAYKLREQLCKVPLLVMDDIDMVCGRVDLGTFGEPGLHRIIRHRYERSMPTVVTTIESREWVEAFKVFVLGSIEAADCYKDVVAIHGPSYRTGNYYGHDSETTTARTQ